jgi:hypothetical protein
MLLHRKVLRMPTNISSESSSREKRLNIYVLLSRNFTKYNKTIWNIKLQAKQSGTNDEDEHVTH